MIKKCIVSFANSKGYYINGLARLNESLRNNFDGDFLGFIGEQTIGAPLHSDNPYAFKIYCIQKAIDAGYEQILWLDSSVFAIKNVQPVFDMIEKTGYAVQDSGHWLGHWANDLSLEYFGIRRDTAMKIRMIGNAGFLGLNMRSPISTEFFNKWRRSMEAGIFKGKWNNDEKTESEDERCFGHRHDMVCSSAIFYQMGITPEKMIGGEEILQYAGLYDKVLNDTIIFKAQGL